MTSSGAAPGTLALVTDVTVLLVRVRESRPNAPGYQRLLDDLDFAAESAVQALGWIPHTVSAATTDRSDLLTAGRASDLIVILGGEDVDPRLYGGATSYPGSGHHEPTADTRTIALILDAVARRAPLLGICRGHQLLNVALGGTLVEHMEGHRGTDATYVTTPLTVTDEHLAALVTDWAPQCTHHQCVREPAADLRVIATAPDGVVEAVAHRTAPAWGVQWHPEHPEQAEQQLTALMRHLLTIG